MVNGIVQAAPTSGNNSIRFSQLYGFSAFTPGKEAVSVKYVLQGEERYAAHRQTHRLRAGRYLVFEKGRPYETALTGRELNLGLCVDLDRNLLGQTLAAVQATDPLAPAEDPTAFTLEEGLFDANDALGGVLHALAATAAQQAGKLEATTDCYYTLAYWLLVAQRQVKGRMASVDAKSPAVQKELYRRVQTVQHYIHDNLAADLSVPSLATQAALSPFHFLRVFRQVAGLTPHQYVLRARLREAEALLHRRSLTVTEVAAECGFADIFSFSKAFKKQFGVAPGAVARG